MSEKTISEHAADLLELAADKFSNHGCNDYAIENNEANRALVLEMEKFNDPEFDEADLNFSGDKIYVMDWFLMRFCAAKLKEKQLPVEIIEDEFGSAWNIVCPECKQNSMHVVRPGKAQCGNCG